LNAVHATPEGGRLGIESVPNGKLIEVRVWDSGYGLPKEHIGRIFDPFFTTRHKGTGLGLTIVHNIVSVHGGSIEADNRPEGGATFSIVLPKSGYGDGQAQKQ
ncbi:hybrid sensor histidine kinase/response regulator, partial [bacterium]|nr:hybrid sensor histidine kinase/response regulator [bacterium]